MSSAAMNGGMRLYQRPFRRLEVLLQRVGAARGRMLIVAFIGCSKRSAMTTIKSGDEYVVEFEEVNLN